MQVRFLEGAQRHLLQATTFALGSNSLHVWHVDCERKSTALMFEEQVSDVTDIAFSAKQSLFASATFMDPVVKLWEFNGNTAKRMNEPGVSLESERDSAMQDSLLLHSTHLTCSSDGKIIASLSYNGQLQFWDFVTIAKAPKRINAARSKITAIAFMPNRPRVFVVGTESGVKHLWHLESSAVKQLTEWEAAGGCVIDELSVASDGLRLASSCRLLASKDGMDFEHSYHQVWSFPSPIARPIKWRGTLELILRSTVRA